MKKHQHANIQFLGHNCFLYFTVYKNILQPILLVCILNEHEYCICISVISQIGTIGSSHRQVFMLHQNIFHWKILILCILQKCGETPQELLELVYKSHEAAQRAGAPLLQRQGETGSVQPGEKRASRETSLWSFSARSVYKKAGKGRFVRKRSGNTRGHDFILKEERFSLDVRRKFFTLTVVRHWHCLPESCRRHIPGDAQSCVGMCPVQPNLVGSTQPTTRSWNCTGFKVALNTNHSVIT